MTQVVDIQEKNIMIGQMVEDIVSNIRDLEECKAIIRSWQGDLVKCQYKQAVKAYSSRTGIRDLNRLVKIANVINMLDDISLKAVGVSLIIACDSNRLDVADAVKSIGFRQLKDNSSNSLRFQWDLTRWYGNHLNLLEKFSIYQ